MRTVYSCPTGQSSAGVNSTLFCSGHVHLPLSSGCSAKPLASPPATSIGAALAEKVSCSGTGPALSSMRVRVGGLMVAETFAGSTFSGVSPCHHFIRAGLASQRATAINTKAITSSKRCCSQRSRRASERPSSRSHEGGCHDPKIHPSIVASGAARRANSCTSTSLALASTWFDCRSMTPSPQKDRY